MPKLGRKEREKKKQGEGNKRKKTERMFQKKEKGRKMKK